MENILILVVGAILGSAGVAVLVAAVNRRRKRNHAKARYSNEIFEDDPPL
jgi:hypothetical protein